MSPDTQALNATDLVALDAHLASIGLTRTSDLRQNGTSGRNTRADAETLAIAVSAYVDPERPTLRWAAWNIEARPGYWLTRHYVFTVAPMETPARRTNKGKTRCPASGRPLSEVPGADHWHATCPVCDKGFNLPQYRLPVHFRCEHKDVSRPTSADPNYRCNVCGELLCEAFDGDVPAEPTPAPRRGCTFAVRQPASLSASWQERQAGWCQAEALPDDDYCATHAQLRDTGALYQRTRARNPRASFTY